MNSRSGVIDFFLAIDSQDSILSATNALIELASTEEGSQVIPEAFGAIQAFLRDKERPIITQKQVIVYERLRRSSMHLEDYGVPDFVESLLTVLYLRAKVALQTVGSRPLLRNYVENFKGVNLALDALPDDFLGELIVEAEIRANRDPSFAKMLNITAKEIITLGEQLEALKEQGVAFLKPIGNCECVGVGCNNKGDCQEFCIESWWTCLLLFLALIIVVVFA